MKLLYFDCFSGISGDMVLGAFIDLGIDPQLLIDELAKLNLSGYEILAEKTMKKGISGTHCHVHILNDTHHHRHYSDIERIILNSTLTDSVKNTALAIFKRVAIAEGKVHNVPMERVHFHEVGALDSIIDIVGASICFHHLNPDIVYGSKINVGSGWVRCAHGLLPVPAPATAEILCDSGFEIYSKAIDGESATPTGVAIISELGTYSPVTPTFAPVKTGYGFGTKDFGILNALRIIQGEKADTMETMVIETNMDDMTGEMAGYVLEKLMQAGALDAFYTPIYMKKNRPGIHLTVLCQEKKLSTLEELILKETSTIGIRKYPVTRTCMDRSFRTINTPYGDVNLKVVDHGNIHRESPEYEDLKKVAINSGKSLYEVIDLVNALK
ncbi:nickel pincer cofactor biosynthesis protein LarC [Eubacteriaceae bacterium ES3]|nr:nickel pincer cofactor biosynthesis protein LarC [Eubacteriaceae bacterium ES3]